jgi:uncharacterized protein (TIGR02466 family)
MPPIEMLFPTQIYQVRPGGAKAERQRRDLERSCLALAEDDRAGQAWCREHDYRGYTSYGSLEDLVWRDPAMAELAAMIETHVKVFAEELDFDLGDRPLALDNLWVNILEPGGMHSGHIHPGSVVSGTYYVALPEGAQGLKFEDPRLQTMMASPPRRAKAGRHNRSFIEITPKPGTILLWESWLRHEVPPSRAREKRISISFNYNWPQRVAS